MTKPSVKVQNLGKKLICLLRRIFGNIQPSNEEWKKIYYAFHFFNDNLFLMERYIRDLLKIIPKKESDFFKYLSKEFLIEYPVHILLPTPRIDKFSYNLRRQLKLKNEEDLTDILRSINNSNVRNIDKIIKIKILEKFGVSFYKKQQINLLFFRKFPPPPSIKIDCPIFADKAKTLESLGILNKNFNEYIFYTE